MNDSDTTIKTYIDNFDKYVERTPTKVDGCFKEWIDAFLSLLPKSGNIFEIGSAAGRDAKYFASQGLEVFCTDIIPEALKKLSKEGFETSEFDFRNEPKHDWYGKFDGIFANATLLHAPLDIFKKALNYFPLMLKKNGVVAFSLKTGKGEEIITEKMDAPRYFRYYTQRELEKIIAELPYEIAQLSTVDKGKWIHVILKVKQNNLFSNLYFLSYLLK